MRAELKRLHSPDVDVRTYLPQNPNHFGFLLQAMIGYEGSTAEESFDFLVCTPSWMQERYAVDGVAFGKHFLIAFDYNIDHIKTAIAGVCEKTAGNDWHEIANKLNTFGKWEFSDYQRASSKTS